MRIALTRRAVVFLSATALSWGMLLPAGTADAVIFIDQFTSVAAVNPWPYTSNTVGSNTVTESALGGVIGGVRKTTITTNSIGAPALDSVHVTIDPNSQSGVLDFATTLQASADLTLLYDGGTGDLNANLATESAFRFVFLGFDLGIGGPNTIRVTINDGANSATGSFVIFTDVPNPLILPFASFTGIGSVNLASINTIQVEFDLSSSATDFRLNEIHTLTIPAPAAAWAFGVMLPGGRRRRA